jgi:hypothetical protein
LGLFRQDAAYGGAPDLQLAGDFGFAGTRTVELTDLLSVVCYREWSAQALAVLAGVGQSGADSFSEDLPFELCEHG